MMYKNRVNRAAIIFTVAVLGTLSAGAWAGERNAESDFTALKAAKNLPAEIKDNLDLYQVLFQNYYTNRDVLSDTELDLVSAAFEAAGLVSAAGKGKHIDLTKTMVGTKKSVTFNSRVTRIGDKSVGAVFMRVPNSSAEVVVVEVERPLPKRVVQEQMQTIVQRIGTLASSDPRWWMQLDVKRHPKNGEYIVHHAKSPDDGIVVTADSGFARLSGMTAPSLAGKLTRDIKVGLGGAPGGRAGTPRDEAMKLRSEGDELFETNLAGAEGKYRLAMQTDPSYPHAYERLAQVAEKQGKAEIARQMRERIVSIRDLEDVRQSTDSSESHISAYRERLAADPGALYPYILLVQEYRKAGSNAELDSLKEAIRAQKALNDSDRKFLIAFIEKG